MRRPRDPEDWRALRRVYWLVELMPWAILAASLAAVACVIKSCG